ncbi:hypothetical protein GOP47_0030186 [Adiantum capillus-veneris]|nr:hypothetical protein GOP47_0030186 [Adiantum capillus-veneris]
MLQPQGTLIPLFFFSSFFCIPGLAVLCVCSSIAEVSQKSQDPLSPFAFANGVSAEGALHSYSSHTRSFASRSRTLLFEFKEPAHIWSSESTSTAKFSGRRGLLASADASNTADKVALLAFKAGIAHDPHKTLSSWSTSGSAFPCNGSWAGVRCDSGGRVVSLDLHAQNLTGSITPFLANLTLLTHLNLSINSLTGRIPPQLGLLASLAYLDFKENSLTGPIPAELGNCTSLLWLDVSHNQLNGTIPTSLGQISDLFMLQLHDLPSLTGPIPSQLGNLTNLTYLYLGSNNLIGSIPLQLGNLHKLKELYLILNKLNGTIPAELGRLQNLEYLALFINKLEGSIPPHLGNLTSLKYFWCLSNNLEGTIPAELGNLRNLIELDLSYNYAISGAIPPELGQLNHLQALKLFQMNLSGSIPKELGNLSNLQHLYAFNNKLSGAIPPELGQLKRLINFNFYFNHLSGPLPVELAKLQNLENLVLFSNSLNGSIPPQLGDMKALLSLYLGDNVFTGNLPEKLGNLENLRYFEVSPNLLTGSIPGTLGKLKDLIYIDLSKNKFSGTLPEELANCTKLQWLRVSNNTLSGEIPIMYTLLQELHTLALANNRFIGSLPADFVNSSSLVVLDFQRNQFTGQLPDSWAQLENLRVLSVGYNHLEGSIPDWLWSLNLLQLINLANNNFSGTISSQISKAEGLKYNVSVVEENRNLYQDDLVVDLKGSEAYFKYLFSVVISLDLSGNMLTGTIPSEIGVLRGLFNLNLSGNALTGPIPHSLANVLTLQSLDLSDNSLSGEIPPQLTELTALAFLNLSYNQFSGRIPEGNQFDLFLNESYLGNPDLCGYPLSVKCAEGNNQDSLVNHSSTTKWKIIGGCVSGVVATACVIGLAWYLVLKKRKAGKSASIQIFDKRVSLSVKELLGATNNFSDSNIIGRGGSCTVYRGILSNNLVVAVKKLDNLSHQEGQSSFVSEFTVLGQIRHRNLVRILGTLATAHINCLVLEYIPNGDLDMHLHKDGCVLSWDRRLQVAIGVAQGLAYLHCDSGVGQILHCDLKPSNILLDEDYEPHISDFGIARLICAGKDGESAVEAFRGSFGYVAPEYAYGGKITAKGDVYSFGIVLLEMLSRKRPTSDAFAEATSMTLWAEAAFHTNWIDVIDPALTKELADEKLKHEIYSVLVIAMSCVKRAPADRPSMTDVLNALLYVRQGKPSQISFDELICSATPDKYGLAFLGDTSSDSSSILLSADHTSQSAPFLSHR